MADQLPRSEISFRRQGSSGLVWDDKLVAGALQGQTTKPDNTSSTEPGATGEDGEPRGALERSRSTGGRPYRTVKVPSPTADPPSPKFSGCCGMFGKPVSARHHPKSNRRRS